MTTARRSQELIALLVSCGATVVHAPAIRIIPLIDDIELRRVTTLLVDNPPDVLIVTTGIGLRGWIEAAHGWHVADDLIAALASTRILARGPKERGAIGQAGLREQWSPESEASAEVLERLLTEGVAGLRIAVQLHGAAAEWEPNADICDPLTLAGAHVIKVPVYRWAAPADSRPMDQLIAMIIRGQLDAVSFTSAAAVASMLQRAEAIGSVTELVAALRDHVAAMCVGPVTSAPLRRLGVPTVHPERYRLGELARLISDEVPRRARQFSAGGHHFSVRAATVAVDGNIRTISPGAMALLRRLMANPGRVVSQDELLTVLPGGGADTHAVEAAMVRLRSALGAPRAIQTVVKRGYRLAIDAPTS
uniref:Bifunctional uroporphyrinogen-III synthetase/response regulator domain protein n=1 Tax=Mycobacterium riyadhense TaxID=486698 RepID=A0A653F2T0_9MYCO|nr:bifunctional uroporphyrinogen-III synthetase/response regulator domain protein [Mycobacterium riyadhense]